MFCGSVPHIDFDACLTCHDLHGLQMGIESDSLEVCHVNQFPRRAVKETCQTASRLNATL